MVRQARQGRETVAHALESIADLKTAPYNPREIDGQAARGLSSSLKEFGDISGFVWNRRSGHLVCGHQRRDQLARHGELKLEGFVWTGEATPSSPDGEGEAWMTAANGERFRVRCVDWDDVKEKAANLVANNAAITGMFTIATAGIIEEIGDLRPDYLDNLMLDKLLKTDRFVDVMPDPGIMQAGDAADDAVAELPNVIPEMELQPFEHYDYVLILATNVHDWEWLADRLKLSKVNASPIAGSKKIGLGRGIKASKLIELVTEREQAMYKLGLTEGRSGG